MNIAFLREGRAGKQLEAGEVIRIILGVGIESILWPDCDEK